MKKDGKIVRNQQLAMCTLGAFLILGLLSFVTLGGTATYASPPSQHLRKAHPEITAESIAHYARSRALLIKAINEFDKGRALAKPDELLDSTKWRNTLIDRAEDLEKVLDPQPRATKGGIYFEADSRLLPEAKK